MSPIHNPSKAINTATAEQTQQCGSGCCLKKLKAAMWDDHKDKKVICPADRICTNIYSGTQLFKCRHWLPSKMVKGVQGTFTIKKVENLSHVHLIKLGLPPLLLSNGHSEESCLIFLQDYLTFQAPSQKLPSFLCAQTRGGNGILGLHKYHARI